MVQTRREVLRWVVGGLAAGAGLLPRNGYGDSQVVTSSFFTEFTSITKSGSR